MKKEFGIIILLGFASTLMSCGGEKKDTENTVSAEVKNEATSTEVAEIDMAAGEIIYNKYCHLCHKEGIAGAPKLGNKELWTPRAEKGMATLIKHVNDGYTGESGVMPMKGTCMECTEDDFRNAISYLLSKADLTAK